MADSIVRLRVDSQEYDNKLKRAAEGLNRYIEGCRKAGGTLEHVDDGVKEFTQELGKMGTVAGGAKGKLGEMTKAFTDLTMQFNQMTEAEKRGQFGKALSSGLDELKQRIISTKKELADINNSLNGGGAPSAGGLFGSDKLSGMLQVFGGNLLTKGAGMLAGFASEMGDMVKQGIELARQGEGIRIAFERLNKPGLLDNLREATHGTLTDLELMKAAVQFNDFKLPLEELGTMLEFAQKKAKDTGQSVDYMAQSIVTGLGRKSVMILDNLGLSAAEIKEKMKDTGDMTKAVGEIIREQMAKAGDYVETAADRATKANVELENAMTRLGETFQPLTDAANSMWTDIKVGALDLLNNAIRPLINAFTEAGRARALYEKQGGDARVNRQLDRLKGIQSDSYRQGTYKAQLRNYDTQIASHEQYLKDYKAWQSDNTNVGAYDRMQKFKQQTGLEWVSDVQAHLDAFKKMRSEYVQGAKAILEGNPVPSPTSTTATTPTGGGSGNSIANIGQFSIPDIDPESLKQHEKPIEHTSLLETIGEENMRKYLGMPMGEQTRDWGKELGKVLANYIDDPDKNKRKKAKEEEDGDFLTDFGKVTNSVTNIASGLQALGVEIPEGITKTLGVIQTISGVLSAILAITTVISATSQANATANWLDAMIPFAHGGMIKAFSGTLVGNTYSGDQLRGIDNQGQLYGLNAGEVVLNRAQVGTLSSMLQGVGQMSNGTPYITGELIFLGLNNYLKSTGRGEMMTSRFKG